MRMRQAGAIAIVGALWTGAAACGNDDELGGDATTTTSTTTTTTVPAATSTTTTTTTTVAPTMSAAAVASEVSALVIDWRDRWDDERSRGVGAFAELFTRWDHLAADAQHLGNRLRDLDRPHEDIAPLVDRTIDAADTLIAGHLEWFACLQENAGGQALACGDEWSASERRMNTFYDVLQGWRPFGV